ncbi:hypothetical protein [Neobacillus niacini]|uniref:hypothetical protein n=1 Tax=Neobacillus niacini TaxID=86668 RepID=UPI001C8EE19E|nr:hypothetical protein [Neobacillus niacini]MBY0144253.1 hypothetical protein [Neobacillus niacini]
MDDIEKMKKEIAAMKADRIARGLPADPPAEFVPVEVGYLLFERCKPLFDFLVKYAKLCGDSQRIPPIDDSKLEPYVADLELIGETIGGNYNAFSVGMRNAMRLVKSADQNAPEKFIRSLLLSLKLASIDAKKSLNEVAYGHGGYADVKAKYEAYKSDEALFDAELSRLKEHYESIKHLY